MTLVWPTNCSSGSTESSSISVDEETGDCARLEMALTLSLDSLDLSSSYDVRER